MDNKSTRIKPMRIRGKAWYDKYLPEFLIAPSFVIIVGVMIIPIIYSLVLSFSDLSLSTQEMTWNGGANYAAMVRDPDFWNSVWVTLAFTGITVVGEIALGVAIALVLDKNFKGRGFVRGLMILPWALPGVVNAIMWKWIFNANYGPMNALLTQVGLLDTYQVWLGQPVSAFFCIVMADVWKETPYVVLLTIAALANISQDMYEAARIDGASGWKTFWHITLPLIRPVIIVLLITKTIWALQCYDLVYIMTAGGPVGATDFITLFIQRTAFKYQQFGEGSAMSYAVTMLCFGLTYLYIKVFMRDTVNAPPKQPRTVRRRTKRGEAA